MPAVAHPYMRRLARPLACVVALCALTFLLQIAPHLHENSHDEAACRLCQAAHLGVSPAVALPTISAPLVSFGMVSAVVSASLAEFFFEQSPSRAPPLQVL
jgi:hypothetical protein